jgi:hypothetical protein
MLEKQRKVDDHPDSACSSVGLIDLGRKCHSLRSIIRSKSIFIPKRYKYVWHI